MCSSWLQLWHMSNGYCCVVLGLHDELARAEEETEKMKKKDKEREKSLEKLECVVKKLKEDRTHYRSLAEKNE